MNYYDGQPLRLTMRGRALFDFWAWPMPAQVVARHTLDKVPPGCVHVEWTGGEAPAMLHTSFLEPIRKGL